MSNLTDDEIKAYEDAIDVMMNGETETKGIVTVYGTSVRLTDSDMMPNDLTIRSSLTMKELEKMFDEVYKECVNNHSTLFNTIDLNEQNDNVKDNNVKEKTSSVSMNDWFNSIKNNEPILDEDVDDNDVKDEIDE